SAKESTKRYINGKELSILDGIPFFVHEGLKIKDFSSRLGTSLINIKSQSNDEAIQKLVDLGAVCCGYANMVQLGINPIGFNTSIIRPSVRNPWNKNYYCGGATSGISAIVASGLTPFCVGLEGLGSVRLTAGMTGIVGFKSTFVCKKQIGVLHEDRSPFCNL
ncbi:hypothetical protein MXB_1581, partial [Myxobolus squamalis]